MRFRLGPMAIVALAILLPGTALAGSIVLTGHDVLLHSGQNNNDAVTLDFLRGSTAKANYDIAVLGGGAGSGSFTGGSQTFGSGTASGSSITLDGTLAGYSSATYWRADTASALDWNAILGADAIVILSFTGCGGCDGTLASSNAINAQSGAIATAFNAGMDIWGISGDGLSTFYDFLPPGAAASGPPIGGSSGFVSTADGIAAGLVNSNMINGFPTHNRFVAFDPDFSVWEVRPQATGPDEVITIAIADAIIDAGGGGIGVGPGSTIPEPSALLLFGVGTLVVGRATQRRRA